MRSKPALSRYAARTNWIQSATSCCTVIHSLLWLRAIFWPDRLQQPRLSVRPLRRVSKQPYEREYQHRGDAPPEPFDRAPPAPVDPAREPSAAAQEIQNRDEAPDHPEPRR